MGAVDKNALGTAAVLGLRTDLKLKGQEYSCMPLSVRPSLTAGTASLIFFGQIATLFPALFAMQRYPAAKVISGCVIMWGVLSMCIAATSGYAGLAVCRFILGMFESLTFPVRGCGNGSADSTGLLAGHFVLVEAQGAGRARRHHL